MSSICVVEPQEDIPKNKYTDVGEGVITPRSLASTASGMTTRSSS